MKQIYIVTRGGCLSFVSSDSRHVVDKVGVTLIDLDDPEDDPTDRTEKDAALKAADEATRIY